MRVGPFQKCLLDATASQRVTKAFISSFDSFEKFSFSKLKKVAEVLDVPGYCFYDDEIYYCPLS